MEQLKMFPDQNQQKIADDTEDRPKTKDLTTKCGEAIGALLCLCATAVVVALTVKFIFWLF